MKTAKRLLAVALSVVLALAVFAFPASAVDGTMTFAIETAETSYAPGDTVTVNIYVSSDFNATCMRIPVLYSKDVFEIPSSGDIRLTSYGTCLQFKNSLDANTDVSTTPIDLFNVTDYYDGSTYGIVAIQWTATITSSAINSFKSTESVKCFSFQLKVKSGASGEGTILIPAAETLKPAFAFYNQAIIDSADATTLCRVNATFTTDEWSVTIDEGGVDGITAFPGSDIVIDYESKIIKNWFDGMDKTAIETNVMPTGNATLQFRASTASGEWGTGSKVRVWSGSTFLADYINLLYGDVDGDGAIAGADATTLGRVLAAMTELEDDPIYEMAADIDGSGDVAGSDLTKLDRYLSAMADIDQSM